MSDYIVSARKYRPEIFESVVGQESVTTTLENAIKNDKIAQAYLFCGPRGVGKTTCARIFAREINKVNNQTENLETSLNVFELDAASNNSVEDIRNLISQVRISPQKAKYKVYIIDEVHMLSTSAFNAFLKTLEEPPAHAIFILATTEKHKILPTILSRCQVYDFKRISVTDIANHLKKIADNEEIAYDIDALHIIAEKADGGLRDSLSIFDQLSSSTNQNLTYNEVLKNLNVLDSNYYFQIVDSLFSNDYNNVILILNDIIENGFDEHNFLLGLAKHIRNLLICKNESTLKLLETSDNIKNKYFEQSNKIDVVLIVNYLRILSQADVDIKLAKNTRLLLEMNLIKMCTLTIDEKKKN